MTISWISVQLLRKDYSGAEARCVSQQQRLDEIQYTKCRRNAGPPNRPENGLQRQTHR
jgi:hypothetical protein